MKVTLFTNHFQHQSIQRQAEIDECLNRNISNALISRVIVLGQSDMKECFSSPKLTWIDGDYSENPYGRPTFRNYFDLVNRYVESPEDVSIVANSDLYFDDSLTLLEAVDLEGVCIALTRWELTASGPKVEAWDNSQDTWIFQGRIRPISCVEFPMGIFCCDNRLAWELRHADYRVINPCFDLRSYHLHTSNVRYNGTSVDGPIENVIRCKWKECNLRPKRLGSTGIIAFSLWGSDPKYNIGAIENAKLARHIYPGWIIRFYLDETVPLETVRLLQELKVEVVYMPRSEGCEGRFWRLLVADDRSVARWMVRDADSRLNYRERRAVDEWIASGRKFHVMRDHPFHTKPIHGVGFGGVRGAIDNMAGKIAEWDQKSGYGDDESFLAAVLWDSVERSAIIHDAFAECYDDTCRPFPTDREFGRFVGERCYQDEHWAHCDRDAIWNSEGRTGITF